MSARLILVAALAIACHAAMAQTETAATVPAPLAVQRLAPQLVTFAGSEINFQNLVNGLTAGTQVQLFTTLSNGFTQSVTFTPASANSPAQVAQILEAARQQLIGLGIGSPTAEQIGFTLMGGLVPTALGGTQLPGLANAQATTNSPSRAAQIQQQAAAGATAPPAQVTNAVNVQTTPSAVTTTTVTAPRQTSDSLIAPGATSRSAVPLTGPAFSTSSSPAFNTSASPAVNTSASPPATTPSQAPGAGSTPPAAERVPAGARPSRN